MTMDEELILIDKNSSFDDIGNSITSEADETKTPVYCGVRSVTRSEHYAAAASDFKPEYVFVVNRYEYAGQREVEYGGKRYHVIRSYSPDKAKGVSDFENTELICGN